MTDVSMPFTMSGYDWTMPVVVMIITLVALVVFIFWVYRVSRERGPKDKGVVIGVLFYSFLFVLAVTGTVVAISSENHDHGERVAVLHDFKYDNPQVDGREFTASKNGLYVRGQFIKDGNKWRIVILEGAQ